MSSLPRRQRADIRVCPYIAVTDLRTALLPDEAVDLVVADEGGPDILLHANVLRNYGQSSVADGAGIELLAMSGCQTATNARISQ